MDSNVTKTLELLKQGVSVLIPEAELIKKLSLGKPLTVKFGADPTAPDLHLGHTLPMLKLKQFQDLGHNVIFLIGDFTARIGDPSGKSKTRPPLSEEQIKTNAKTYLDQVGKILDIKKVQIRFNSEWLEKISLSEFLTIAGRVTLARLIERDDFQKRMKENTPIGFHELFYPIFQGYDSVALKADVELGGTDQTFNLLMGRTLQESFGQAPQVIMATPLLEGLDGVKKMSKSLGNYVGLTEPAEVVFGKLMSISDELMWRYYELLLAKPQQELDALRKQTASGAVNPMNLKKEMAFGILKKLWSQEEAEAGQKHFEALFQNKDYTQAQEVELSASTPNPVWIVDLLKALGAIKASSEAKRLIESKAVSIDGEVVTDFKANVTWKPGMVVKAGKCKIYKVK